jgi:membrane peptidoglycan carboxypeptidase
MSLLVCGLLAGLVVAAAAFPAVAMSGLAAKAGADTFGKLPTELDVLPVPQISYVYASDGKTLLAMLYDENRRNVTLDEVAKVMQDAMVASEDSRFFQHKGVDVKGVARAFVANQRAEGTTEQGASTLTMQYVRQVISYSARTPQQVIDATAKTPARKMREMKLAIEVEKRYTKQQILERYLNIASYGQGAYGIFAASQVYFGKPPSDLTLGEATIIAGLVKAPSEFNPATQEGRPKALERRVYVLNQMVEMKMITPEQKDAALKEELKIIGQRTPEGCAAIQRPELGAGFTCDFFVRWWLAQPAFGADTYERESKLRSGGYKITLAMDLTTQAAAFKYAKNEGIPTNHLAASQRIKLGMSQGNMLAAIEPGTGRVIALAANRTFSNDQSINGPNKNPAKAGRVPGNYPNTTVPIITGGPDVSGYQAGSAFKIFTIVAALENGFPLDTPINTTNPFRSNYIVEQSSPAACPGTRFYCPKNSGSGVGNFNMWTGLGSSINTFFVPLQQMVGAAKVVDAAKRMGIQFRAPSDADFASTPARANGWGAFTLGVSATTPLDLANAFATLAADGLYCEPIPVLDIRDINGNKHEAANPRCKQNIDPDVARAAVDAARCPVGDQSTYGKCVGKTAGNVRGIVGRPVAGKTGTTDSSKSATLTAMTKNLAVSGFLTDPDWPETTQYMAHPPVNMAVAYTLRDGVAGKPVIPFQQPSRDKAFGKRVAIPNVACQPVAAAQATLKGAGFSTAVAQQPIPSQCPAGTVAKTEPGGSTVRGGAVTIYLSSGPGAAGPGAGGPGGGGGNPPRPRPTPTKCPVPWICDRD